MDIQIVVDSSADFSSEELSKLNGIVKIVPLSVFLDGKEYLDIDSCSTTEMLENLKTAKKATSSCPSPNKFLEVFTKAKNTICITLSKKLSGTYNSAQVAMNEARDLGYNVYLVDSKYTAGVIRLMAYDAINYIDQGLSIENIVSKLESTKYNLAFMLSDFTNLIKTGRMSKVTAMVASFLFICPILIGEDGEIKLYKRIRTYKKALEGLTDVMVDLDENIKNGGKVIISHCNCLENANILKTLILKKYSNLDIEIAKSNILTSFYSQQDGLILSFKSN